MKFSLPLVTKSRMEVIKLYANTMNNNGISIYIDPGYTIQGSILTGNFSFEYADLKYDMKVNSIDQNYTYLIVIMKNHLKMSVYLYPNIADISSTANSKIEIVQVEIPASKDVLLSNKEMRINGSNNLYAYMFNVGIYNKALTEQGLMDIYDHIKRELQKSNLLLIEFNTKLDELAATISDLKKCPYDEPTCANCTGITDWSDMNNIILNGTPECFEGINKFCIANPDHPKCVCWNPTKTASRGRACKNYTTIFNTTHTCVQEPPNIEEIKKANNLCDCNALPKAATNIETPKLLANTYNFDKSDLELYNDIDIKKI